MSKSAQDIWDLYNKGIEYNQNLSPSLYETVKNNENFYIGDQWHDVNAPDLDKPVFNFLKRVISYFIAMIASDDISISITPFEDDSVESNKRVCDAIAYSIEQLIEQQKVMQTFRQNVRDAAVDGDSASYVYFDPTVDTGSLNTGCIKVENLDNTDILFGNPYNNQVQSQPYIIIQQRRFVETLKKDAVEMYHISPEQADLIQADNDSTRINDNSSDLVTVLFYFYKDKGSIHYSIATKELMLKSETDLGVKDYPIAYWSWDQKKNTYHGQAPITGMIPNQIFVNKLFAMCMLYVQRMGFPWMAFDNTKISAITNKIGQGYGTNPDIANKLMDFYKAPDFSSQILNLIDVVINYTRDFMGANDAALGNVKPDNTSAIIAVQEAAAVPLEMQHRTYYQFVEDTIRNMIEVMAEFYGTRDIVITDDSGATQTINIDFSKLKGINYQISVDVGKGGIYDENTRIQTLGNLWDRKILTDAVTFVRAIPDKMLPDKDKIISGLKQQQEAAMVAANADVSNQNIDLQNQKLKDAIQNGDPNQQQQAASEAIQNLQTVQ